MSGRQQRSIHLRADTPDDCNHFDAMHARCDTIVVGSSTGEDYQVLIMGAKPLREQLGIDAMQGLTPKATGREA